VALFGYLTTGTAWLPSWHLALTDIVQKAEVKMTLNVNLRGVLSAVLGCQVE
jgi:hypothetical protein